MLRLSPPFPSPIAVRVAHDLAHAQAAPQSPGAGDAGQADAVPDFALSAAPGKSQSSCFIDISNVVVPVLRVRS